MKTNRDIPKTFPGGSIAYRIVRLSVLVFLFVLFNRSILFSQSQKEIEYRFKAVYLFNFLQFTEWPDSAFENSTSPIIIGIIGEDPFGPVLEEAIQSEKINDRSIVVRRFRWIDEVTHCHALFVSPSEKENLNFIFRRVADLPILTMSDLNHFGDSGGAITFYLENNRIRFEVNMNALRRSGLKLSSKLLRLARIVNPL